MNINSRQGREVWNDVAALALSATESAAVACYPWIGKKDKNAADEAAVKAISNILNASPYEFYVAIGEGELDNAPKLSVGDRLGNSSKYKFDVAVDPLEGTTLCSLGLPGSVSALAFGADGSVLSAPDSYLNKLLAGPNCPDALVDIDIAMSDLIPEYSAAVGKKISDVTICVLNKPRHAELIRQISEIGANVLAIPDADIPAAIWVCDPETYGVDLYVGVGGGPEGILSAAALKCLGGKISARFAPQNDSQASRIEQFDQRLLGRKLKLNDLVSQDVIFSMSSITGSKGLRPIHIEGNMARIESICLGTTANSPGVVKRSMPLPK